MMDSSIQNKFVSSANAAETKPKTLSLRLTPEERVQLEKEASGLSLSAYVRSRLFGSNVKKRKTRGKAPIKDHQALAKVLGGLARLEIFMTVKALLKLVQSGNITVKPDTERALQQACTDIHAMRHDLITALGIKPE